MNSIPPLNSKGAWRTYTTADGLAGLQTEHIAEDAEGYLWIGAWDNGACRFDGDEFRTFTIRDGLPGNRGQALLLDKQGRLWFGTQGGVCWWDGKRFHGFEKGDGVSDQIISFLFEDQEGRIWCAGPEALGYYDGSTFCNLYPEFRRQCLTPEVSGPGECHGMAHDEEGRLWIGFGWLVVCYQDGEFRRYAEEDGLPDGQFGYTAVRDQQGVLWVSGGHTLCRFDGQRFQAVPLDNNAQIRKLQGSGRLPARST